MSEKLEERKLRIRNALQNSEAFRGLASAELAEVAKLCREATYEAGSTVFHEGEQGRDLFLVVEGKVALEKAIVLSRRGGARRATVDVATPGRVFGWSAVVAPHDLTASAICVEQTRVLAINGDELRSLLHERPYLGYQVMNHLAAIAGARLRDTTHRLSYLLSIASHDLKAPLAAVESYTQVMLGGFAGPIADKQRQMLERSSERIKEALDLISNFLDVSRLEAGQMFREMEVISITNVVRRALEVVQPAARDKGITIETSVPDDVPGIQGAALRLQQALVNLLSNAVKFTPAGGYVYVSVEDRGDFVQVEVVDTGMGVAAEDLTNIFNDFYRGSNATDNGTGLGLAIAKRIVLAHGGKIWVESPLHLEAQAKGSRFVFTLPRSLSATS